MNVINYEMKQIRGQKEIGVNKTFLNESHYHILMQKWIIVNVKNEANDLVTTRLFCFYLHVDIPFVNERLKKNPILLTLKTILRMHSLKPFFMNL
jgi:hypothetical protein